MRENTGRLHLARIAPLAVLAVVFGFMWSCGLQNQAELEDSGACPRYLESSVGKWVPSVEGLTSLNHDSGVTVSQTSVTVQASLSGAEENPNEVTVEIPMQSDLGVKGSLMLIAEAASLPAGLKGGAYPVLTSLHDGTNELIRLTRSTEGAAESDHCRGTGFFCCRFDSCGPSPLWVISQPSVYKDRDQWEEHQINPFGFVSVNTFPTCNWPAGSPECIFNNSEYFQEPRLRYGGSYTAKYALILDRYASLPSESPKKAAFKLTILKKSVASASGGSLNLGARGAMDLNIVLVGGKNIHASRTLKGQQNLNALIAHILTRFDRNNMPGGAGSEGIRIGSIHVFEWGCESEGDAYAETQLSQLGALLANGSSMLPKERETRALNLFIVSNLLGAGEGFTVLGASGAIGGPMVNGTSASGLAFASFNKLDQFNPLCGNERCPAEMQEKQFVEMGETIAHEIGHFLGLNHPSEANGTRHDALPDTPKCRRTESLARGNYITHRSCRELEKEEPYPATGRSCFAVCPNYDGKQSFCPEAIECQFNHLMWWTAKNFNAGKGDGGLLTEDSWRVIRYSPAIQ